MPEAPPKKKPGRRKNRKEIEREKKEPGSHCKSFSVRESLSIATNARGSAGYIERRKSGTSKKKKALFPVCVRVPR